VVGNSRPISAANLGRGSWAARLTAWPAACPSRALSPAIGSSASAGVSLPWEARRRGRPGSGDIKARPQPDLELVAERDGKTLTLNLTPPTNDGHRPHRAAQLQTPMAAEAFRPRTGRNWR